jgi:hypothetical protein
VSKALQTGHATATSLALFEKALGGRARIIDALEIDATPSVQKFVRLLLNPHFDELSLAELAEQAEASLPDILRAYRNATLAKAQILAANEIAARLPEVAKDVMERALPVEILCPVCRGEGTQLVRKEPQACKTCTGTGKVKRSPSVQRQRLALELAELVKTPKGGTTLLQQFNTVSATPLGPTVVGPLEKMQTALAELLYNRPATIDVTAQAVEVPPKEPHVD